MSETLVAPLPATQDQVDRLTSAARVVLVRGGGWGFKVDSVLRAAGLSTRCFYRHFESKHHLLLRMLQEDMGRAARRLDRVCTDPDPLDRVRAWIDGVMDMACVARVATPTAVFATHWHQLVGTFPEEVEACRQSLLAPLRRALDDLCATGVDLDVETTASALFYLVSAPTAEAISRGETRSRLSSEAWVLPAAERLLGLELPDRSHHAWG